MTMSGKILRKQMEEIIKIAIKRATGDYYLTIIFILLLLYKLF